MEIPYENDSFKGINHFLFSRHNFKLKSEILAWGEYYVNFTEPIFVFDPNVEKTNWVSKDPNKSIPLEAEYLHFLIHLTHYTIRARIGSDDNLPKGWDLHGSFDGENWDLLHTISNSTDLLNQSAYQTYECLNKGSYRYFNLI